ncbi:MAG: ECF-type sigma factor [Rubricoccaceae bacterium]
MNAPALSGPDAAALSPSDDVSRAAPATPSDTRAAFARALGSWLRGDARALGTLLPTLAGALGRLAEAHPACAAPALVDAAVVHLLGPGAPDTAEERLRALGGHVARRVAAARTPGTPIERLDRLAAFDTRAARVAECVYLAGLDVPRASAVLGLTSEAAARLWTFARAWLLAAPQTPLTPMRFAHLRALFDGAPEAPSEAHAASAAAAAARYAARACGPDDGLRQQLSALLLARQAPLPPAVLHAPPPAPEPARHAAAQRATGDGAPRFWPLIRSRHVASPADTHAR